MKLDTSSSPDLKSQTVDSIFPREPCGHRIAIIGDMPFDELSKRPFTNSVLSVMKVLTSKADIRIEQCFQGNLLCFYPPGGQIAKLDSYDTRLKASFSQLGDDLRRFKPEVIVLLCRTSGNVLLGAFKEGPDKLDAERGQPFIADQIYKDCPVVPTYHPKEVFRRYHLGILIEADLKKARRLAEDGWKEKKRNLEYKLSYDEIIACLNGFLIGKDYLSVDIETDKNLKMTCIGMATSATEAICIPFILNGKPYWTVEQEAKILKKLTEVLETNRLLGQNAVHFDHKVLVQNYNILPNFIDDTMYAHWECYPELQKSMPFLNSLYTDNTYHKDLLKKARKGDIPPEQELMYCALDCCCTYEQMLEIQVELGNLPPKARTHYEFNIRASRAFQYMSIRGAMLDKDKLSDRLMALNAILYTEAVELESDIGHALNVRSSKQMKEYLYNELGLPKRQKPVKLSDGTTEDRDTSDYLTLIYFARKYPQFPTLTKIAHLRRLKKRISSLSAYNPRPDGRMGWDFNLVGSSTGRVSGKKPLDKHGVQPQNVDRRDRDLFIPDVGSNWLKVDLEGADNWTIAAQLKALKEPAMMEDLEQKLKPAEILAMAMTYGDTWMKESCNELLAKKEEFNGFKKQQEEAKGKGKTIYDLAKRIVHGSSYMLSPQGMHLNIFKESDGDIFIQPSECEKLQQLLFLRYPLQKLHARMASIRDDYGYLDSCIGTRRTFYGRKDQSTLREMMAHLPQLHTTYVINKIIERLYYAEDNRQDEGNGKFIIDPINQLHDELDATFEENLTYTTAQVFWRKVEVPLDMWGVKFTIPVEAQYGPNWGDTTKEL